ncbi:MAG: UDP-N-acetylmuramoylalanyl-D-glutamyl-2, 6-diaminopimelate--D-alanyl-D-alanine ligase, partial [Alphaproteobacteria bacterium]|nr:UDP-N-acetylmuramoylalanyl-D-glutamyl-2, 6-diaminopimelate--D-alanyl-D-alanine ligase [Alphaproteobacteria bacterium]
IDESYNANPASMAAALALLGAASGRRIAVLGDMLEMGEGGLEHHASLAKPIDAAKTDLVFLNGAQMKALWDALPAWRRGAWAETSAEIAPQLTAVLKPGDTVLVKGSNGSKMSVIIDALKARGA